MALLLGRAERELPNAIHLGLSSWWRTGLGSCPETTGPALSEERSNDEMRGFFAALRMTILKGCCGRNDKSYINDNSYISDDS